jgi:hypothetical protein
MADACPECKINTYEYTDGKHTLSICFKCGRYTGTSNNDQDFVNMINQEPMILMKMIKDKRLTPT